MPHAHSYDGSTHSAQHPSPKHPADQARVAEQAMRDRVLTGSWLADAMWRESTFFDESLRDSMPLPELSRNPALSIHRQLATLYDESPRVTVEEADPDALAVLMPSTLWPLCARRNFLVEGVNECVMRVDWQTTEEDGGRENAGRLSYRVVPAHLILTCRASPLEPDQPVYLEELTWDSEAADGEGAWVVEVWDITGKEPRYALQTIAADGITTAEEEDQEWPSYLVDENGPFLPHVLYHKSIGHDLWSPYEGREVFWGTLTTATLWTFWLFGVRDGAHPQRYLQDLDVVGATAKTVGGQAVQGIVSNPMTILALRSRGDAAGKAGQFEPAMDIKAAGEAIEQFMTGLAIHAGVSPSDISVGSSAKSGYAIAISREGERKARRRQEAPARRGDGLLLAKGARILNQRTKSTLPTDPEAYTIRYSVIAESPQERLVKVKAITEQQKAGLISDVDAYMQLNPGLTEAEAIQALVDIRQGRALLDRAAALPTEE